MAKTIAQLAQEAYERAKRTGVSQTKSGGTVANAVAQQQQAAVKSAQQQADSGIYKTTSGGTVKGTAKPNAYTSGGSTSKNKTTQADVVAAYTLPTVTTKKNPNTGAAPKYDAAAAVKAATESAAKQQQTGKVLTRYGGQMNYTPYLDDEDENGTTDVTQDSVAGAYTLPAGRYTLPEGDPGINYDTLNELMNKYGKTEADLRGLPLEALYLGDSQYVLPYLVTGPDNKMIMSNGNLISTGDYRQALMDGLYLKGNEAALNEWYGRVAQNPEVNTVDPYEYEEESGYGDFDAYEDSRMDAYAQYIQAAIDAIMGQQSSIDQQAADAAAAAYANYKRSQLAMPEQTSGMATGAADSMMLQNDLNLQNVLAGIEADRAGAINDLRTQAAQVEAEGNLSMAELEAQLAAEAYDRQQEAIKAAAAQTQQSSGGGSAKPNLTAAQAMEAYRNGMRTEQVLAAMQYYYGITPEQVAASENVTGGIGGTYVPKTTATPTSQVQNAIKNYEDIFAGAWTK